MLSLEFKNINEFQLNEVVTGFYIIKSVEVKTGSNGKKYMDFVFGDKSGEINGKLWDADENQQQMYTDQMLVKVKGLVNSWQNVLQLKIDLIRPVEERDDVNIEDFVPCAPFEAEYMYNEILNYINNMENREISSLVLKIFEGYKDKLKYYPAAKKNHHSIRTGLLYHIMTMLSLGKKICEIYDFLNSDILYGGIILHDLAKMEEMDSTELGIVREYTTEGTLLGHITQGIKNVELAGRELNTNREIIMILQHMILSHHYEPEYGSPVKPMIPEAEILHHIDIIDARMFDMRKVTAETEPGGFSERLWSLENRRIYKPQEF